MTQCAVDFRGQDRQRPPHAGLAAGSQSVQRRTSEDHGVRTERDGFEDVGSTPNAAIYDEGQFFADGLGDLRQHIQCGHAVLQLPSAMIAQHDAVAAVIGGTLRIRDRQHPFDDELARPDPPQPAHILPGDPRREELGDPGAAANRAGVPGRHEGGEIFQLRHTVAQQHVPVHFG
jgi:hypothetical protein